MDEEFGIKLSDKFNGNILLFWKEVKKESKRSRGVNKKIQEEDEVHVRGKEKVKGV